MNLVQFFSSAQRRRADEGVRIARSGKKNEQQGGVPAGNQPVLGACPGGCDVDKDVNGGQPNSLVEEEVNNKSNLGRRSPWWEGGRKDPATTAIAGASSIGSGGFRREVLKISRDIHSNNLCPPPIGRPGDHKALQRTIALELGH